MLNFDYFIRTFDAYFTGWDFAIMPFILIAIALYGRSVKKKREVSDPVYHYYALALNIKIIGAVLFCLGYTILLRGGDTSLYFWSSRSCANLAYDDFGAYWQILIGKVNTETLSAFNSETGYVAYTRDMRAFAVVRLTSVISLVFGKSYLLTTMALNLVLFNAFWRFFRLLHSLYPHLAKPMFWSVFLIPSVVFWGSGILKDSYTMAATLWFTYAAYYLIIKFDRKQFWRCVLYAIISVYIFVIIKPYILFALIGGISMWFVFGWLKKVKRPFLRVFVFPLLLGLAFVGAGAGVVRLTQSAGGFYRSPETMMERAVIIQNDLKQDYYGDNSFDIGRFDASYSGVMSKSPIAIVSGLFRPFLWEATGPTLFMSAIENTVIMVLLLLAILGRGIRSFFKQLSENHYVVFALSFSMLLAFMIGLTTANFGALVRYKIPFLPLLISALLIIYFNYRKIRKDSKITSKHPIDEKNYP